MRHLLGGMILAVVIILVAGLLSSAIARVREAADRMVCVNNLKQMGLATVNNADTYGGRFPQAAMPNAALPFERRFSWLVEIVPFVQSDPFYSRLAREKAWDAEENRFAAFTEWKCFICPSLPERAPESTFIPTEYIGIAGIGEDAAELSTDDPRAGFFGYERRIFSGNLAKSTLLLAMETSRATGAWTAAGPSTVRGLAPVGLHLGIDGQFGGNHRGIANAVFADGSVHPLRESMDPQVLEAIATIKGSEGVGTIDE
jgi:prepilin-type processing-associated H-X9-DG protein